MSRGPATVAKPPAVSDARAEVRLCGFHFRNLHRPDALHADVQACRAYGSTGSPPLIIRRSGGRMHLIDRQFTRRLAQRWQFPASPQAREILDLPPLHAPQ